jgi:hypothetical protein
MMDQLLADLEALERARRLQAAFPEHADVLDVVAAEAAASVDEMKRLLGRPPRETEAER